MGKSFKDLALDMIEDVIKDYVEGGMGLATNELTPLSNWGVDAVRAFWYRVREDLQSSSGIRKVDPYAAVKEAVRATMLLQKFGKVDAEFVTEAAEEAFSEALMAGIGGALRAEAAIKMGFEPWTNPHSDIYPVFTALADQLTGIYWPNLVHYKIEQLYQEMSAFWQRYRDIITATDAYAYPHTVPLSVDGMSILASQIWQNLADAINALYTRVTEILTIYLGVKTLYAKGYVGKEDYDNALLQLASNLQSVIDNLAMLEEEINMVVDIFNEMVDTDGYDEMLSHIDTITGTYIEQWFDQYFAPWFKQLFRGRVVVPDAGVATVVSIAGRARTLRAYPYEMPNATG